MDGCNLDSLKSTLVSIPLIVDTLHNPNLLDWNFKLKHSYRKKNTIIAWKLLLTAPKADMLFEVKEVG